MAVGQPEADIGGAAGRVDLQLLAQPANEVKDVAPRRIDRADGHDQGIDHHVLGLDPVVLRPLDDQLGDLEAFVRVFGNARLVVRDGDDRSVVFLHQRQDPLHHLAFGSGGIDQRAPLIDGEPRFQCLDDRTVDAERHVGNRLHELHHFGEDFRLVRQRNTGVHIEHLGACLDLRQGVGLHPRIIALLHLGGEQLASGRIDALPDHDEGLVEADHDFLAGGAEYGA